MPLTVSGDGDRAAVGLLVVAFVLAGLAFAVATPLFQNPDEPTHVDMARWYAHHLTDEPGPSVRQTEGSRGAVAATGLRDEPVPPSFAGVPEHRPAYGTFDDYGGDTPATTGCPQTCQNYQYAHPPGWYVLVAPVVRLEARRSFPSVVVGLRLVDVLFASVAVWSAWYIAREVWPERRRWALAAAAVAATFAPFAASAAGVNNDALVFGLMAVCLAMIARILRRGTEAVPVIVLGASVGLGLLTKAEFLAVAPVALLAVAIAPRTGARWQAIARFALPAAVGALWWARVVVDTHSLTPAGSELVRAPSPGPWRSVSIVRYLGDRFPEFVTRFPGFYGWGYVGTSVAWRLAFYGTIGVVAGGWLLCRRWHRPSRPDARLLVLAAVPIALFAAALWSSYSTYHASGEIRGMAPRYVYGALPVFAVAIAAGVGAVVHRLRIRTNALSGVAVLAVASGTVVAFAEAMKGQYATSSLSTMVDRAGVVAPVAHPARWLVAIGAAWIVCIAAAAWLISRGGGTQGAAPARATRSPA